MEREQLPTEGEQFAVYCETAQKLSGQPVIIRTLDIGGNRLGSAFSCVSSEVPAKLLTTI